MGIKVIMEFMIKMQVFHRDPFPKRSMVSAFAYSRTLEIVETFGSYRVIRLQLNVSVFFFCTPHEIVSNMLENELNIAQGTGGYNPFI